ncbi:amidohydrolase family protein [Haloarcula montana]|uniref:amidohydrolase family protein n=1 Tax=Haloarcula montana TaxID=3111776 RepID=UPI002D767ADD|nr:amidohydrolase family protein [Haloarcula sp. GH36]
MLELEHGFRIVDVAGQIEPEEGRRPRPGIGGAEQFEREMRQAGITRALVHPNTREGSYLKANNAVARTTVGRPLVALARLNGVREVGDGPTAALRNFASSRGPDHVSPEDIEQFAYDERFCGFVLDPAEDGLPDSAVLAELSTVSQPVLVHGGERFPPSAVAESLLEGRFPVVLSHFGAHPLRRDLMAEAIDLLDSYDDLYLDTSLVRYRDPLERAIREHPDRVCFGSGAPDAHPNVAVMEILTLDIPEDAMKKAFSNNPGRVFDPLAL